MSLPFLLERGWPLSPLPLQWCVEGWVWLADGLGSTNEGEAGHFPRKHRSGLGRGCGGPGAGPLQGEWRGFPWVRSSAATVCLASQGWETGHFSVTTLLPPFPLSSPSSISFPPWQLGRNLLKSHGCDSL